MKPTLVVGYDGSPAARAALTYAANYVDEGQIYIVTAADAAPDYLGEPHYQHVVDASHARARELLDEAVAELPSGVASHTELLEGSPAEAIDGVARARDADEIVVGSRGLGRIHAALGSVSHDVLHLANRPVVVIPGRT